MVDSPYKGGAVGGAVGGSVGRAGGGAVGGCTNLGGTVLFVPNVRRGVVCTGDVCNDPGVVCSEAGETGTSSQSVW